MKSEIWDILQNNRLEFLQKVAYYAPGIELHDIKFWPVCLWQKLKKLWR